MVVWGPRQGAGLPFLLRTILLKLPNARPSGTNRLCKTQCRLESPQPKPSTTRSTRHNPFTPKMPIFRLSDRSLPNLFNVSMREQSVHTQCTQSQPRNPTEHFTLPPRSFLHSVISGEQASKEGWKREEIEGQYALLSVCHPRVEL